MVLTLEIELLHIKSVLRLETIPKSPLQNDPKAGCSSILALRIRSENEDL